MKCTIYSGGFRGGTGGVRPPPHWAPKFFQFHAVFWENLANLYVSDPAGELVPPLPRENPGSAADLGLSDML